MPATNKNTQFINVDQILVMKAGKYFPTNTVGFLKSLPLELKVGLVSNAICRLCNAECTRLNKEGEATYSKKDRAPMCK